MISIDKILITKEKMNNVIELKTWKRRNFFRHSKVFQDEPKKSYQEIEKEIMKIEKLKKIINVKETPNDWRIKMIKEQ